MFSAADTVRGTGVGLAAVTGAVWSLPGLSQINDAYGIYSVSCADKHAPGFETASALANVGVTAASLAAGGGIAKVATSVVSAKIALFASDDINITQEGINAVKSHLLDLDYADYNTAMVGRLQGALDAGQSVGGPDLAFYNHEIFEGSLMDQEMTYPEAHAAALKEFGNSEYELYRPDVISAYSDQFNSAFRVFWGLK